MFEFPKSPPKLLIKFIIMKIYSKIANNGSNSFRFTVYRFFKCYDLPKTGFFFFLFSLALEHGIKAVAGLSTFQGLNYGINTSNYSNELVIEKTTYMCKNGFRFM